MAVYPEYTSKSWSQKLVLPNDYPKIYKEDALMRKLQDSSGTNLAGMMPWMAYVLARGKLIYDPVGVQLGYKAYSGGDYLKMGMGGLGAIQQQIINKIGSRVSPSKLSVAPTPKMNFALKVLKNKSATQSATGIQVPAKSTVQGSSPSLQGNNRRLQ